MIKLKTVTKRFGATVALSNVSVEFLPGEVHCLLGENGAGKSTIGKMICGLYQPDEGSLEIDGKTSILKSPKDARRLGIAICHQELSLAKHLTVRANLCLGTENVRHLFSPISTHTEQEKAKSVLEKIGLDIPLETVVESLPIGQQQLIEIGKALMLQPKAVVFDEPTAMLGAVEKQKFLQVLRQLRNDGVCVIFVTHHIDDVMAVSDRVTVMRNGHAVDSFSMDESINADFVVERLTGKKRERLQQTRPLRTFKEPVINIDGVSFRKFDTHRLTLHRGQITAIYGVVGCGAEKIIAALTGQLFSSEFQFQLRNKPFRPRSTAQALSHGVAYLPSGRAANCIFPERSIKENMTITQLSKLGKLGLLSPSEEERYCHHMLQQAGVKYGHNKLPITSLSGGNQQKILLARALNAASELLVLEDPSAGVDLEAKALIHEHIQNAAQRGMTVLMLSSDIEESITLSDTLYTMYDNAIMSVYHSPSLQEQPNIIADVLGQVTT